MGTPIESLRYPSRQPPFNGVQTGDIIDEPPKMDSRNDNDISEIARNIDDSLDDIPEQKSNKKKQIDDSDRPKKFGGFMDKIPEILREPLIIIIIFVILSLEPVRKVLSSYIPQIRSSNDGAFALTGILVHALVLAIGFIVLKKLLM